MDAIGVRKVCFKCKQEKDLSEFYKHNQMKDGHLNKCKECTKSDVSIHRAMNIDKIREYDRLRGYLPHRVKNNIERTKIYRSEKPEAYKSHTTVNNAINRGRLTKKPCAVCGSTERVEAHHEDYSRPLDVIFLCSVHHHAVHHKGLRLDSIAIAA